MDIEHADVKKFKGQRLDLNMNGVSIFIIHAQCVSSCLFFTGKIEERL